MGSVGSSGGWYANLNIEPEYDSRVEYWKEQIIKGNNRPILVDSSNKSRIIDGNHTAEAYKQLGIKPEIYSMPRVQFLNGAAESKDTVEYIRKMIRQGVARRVR